MNALSDPVVKINNETIAIKPNSFKYKGGYGESKLLPQSAGNGQIETVYSENAENKISSVKFELLVTNNNIKYVKTFKKNQKSNGITVQEGDTNLTFTGMALTNDPEVTLSAEGRIEMDFNGDPVR